MDDRALVAAIQADPDSDDVARVVADYFERLDPPRAELCRLDIWQRAMERNAWLEQVRGQPASEWPDGEAKYARRRELLAQHGSRWRAELPPGVNDAYDWAFQRGAWAHVEATTTWLCEHGERLFAEQPIVSLTLVDRADLANALALPCLRHVRKLQIESIYTGVAAALGAATTLTTLESLRTTMSGLEAALESPAIRALETFHFSRDTELDDMIEEGPDGTSKVWRSQRGLELENRVGVMPWLHASRWRTFPGTREFGRRWLAARGEPVDEPAIVYAGTYRIHELTVSSLDDEAIQILEAAGYHHARGFRSYNYAQDGGPGWASWVYYVSGIELSDAPWIERVEALQRRT